MRVFRNHDGATTSLTRGDGLQRDLRRKERALAEAAALLVLQKKFQALLGDED